jgi:hypothetical protein
MAAIDEWRAATSLRDQIKALKDFAQIGGNEVLISVGAIQSKVPGGAPAAVAEEVRAYIAQVIQADLRQIINSALSTARTEVATKAVAARDEAEAVLRDAA